jgi:hypothetical protein
MSGHINQGMLNSEFKPVTTPKRQQKSPPHRGPGRPSQGIRSSYARLDVYVPTEVRDGLDRLADRREQQTGETTVRADVIREALTEYLRKHAPEAGT